MLTKLWDARTGRILLAAFTFLVALAFLHAARGTITLFLFAIFFAYLVDPIVSRLRKPLRGRGKAILVFYFLFVGVLVGLGFLLGPRIANEGRSLIASLPALLDRMASGQFVVALAHNEGWDQVKAPRYHIWWPVLIPILSIFFLKNGTQIVQGIVNLRRDGHGNTELRKIVADIHSMLGKYIRAQLILACLLPLRLSSDSCAFPTPSY